MDTAWPSRRALVGGRHCASADRAHPSSGARAPCQHVRGHDEGVVCTRNGRRVVEDGRGVMPILAAQPRWSQQLTPPCWPFSAVAVVGSPRHPCWCTRTGWEWCYGHVWPGPIYGTGNREPWGSIFNWTVVVACCQPIGLVISGPGSSSCCYATHFVADSSCVWPSTPPGLPKGFGIKNREFVPLPSKQRTITVRGQPVPPPWRRPLKILQLQPL